MAKSEKTKMTESTPPSRFVVRKGAERNTWMVWDRHTRGPAKTRSGIAIGLSEAQARQVKVELMLDRGGA
jgi:hypothetical protein